MTRSPVTIGRLYASKVEGCVQRLLGSTPATFGRFEKTNLLFLGISVGIDLLQAKFFALNTVRGDVALNVLGNPLELPNARNVASKFALKKPSTTSDSNNPLPKFDGISCVQMQRTNPSILIAEELKSELKSAERPKFTPVTEKEAAVVDAHVGSVEIAVEVELDTAEPSNTAVKRRRLADQVPGSVPENCEFLNVTACSDARLVSDDGKAPVSVQSIVSVWRPGSWSKTSGALCEPCGAPVRRISMTRGAPEASQPAGKPWTAVAERHTSLRLAAVQAGKVTCGFAS